MVAFWSAAVLCRFYIRRFQQAAYIAQENAEHRRTPKHFPPRRAGSAKCGRAELAKLSPRDHIPTGFGGAAGEIRFLVSWIPDYAKVTVDGR